MNNASDVNQNADSINMTNVSFDHFLINFGHATKEEKKEILRKNQDKKVLMDLTCFDQNEFYNEFPNLVGTFSALFCNEEKKIEIHFKEKSEALVSKLQELGFKPYEISFISHGFVFPRTIVQIINEAYFALEEEVASKEDINRAMKFGVNYPKGPFEWSEGREDIVKSLLNELLSSTKDKRYIASKLI